MTHLDIHHLDGALLDAWVARGQGLQAIRIDRRDGRERCRAWMPDVAASMPYSPSTDWICAAAILDREHIALRDWAVAGREPAFEAMLRRGDVTWFARGELPLVAAMRVYVRSRFTEEEVRLRSFSA